MSAGTVDRAGGAGLFESLDPLFPIVIITALVLCVIAAFAKVHLSGVIGGLLCLVPLLYLLVGGLS